MSDVELYCGDFRRVLPRVIAALNSNVCPQCEGPLEVRRGDVACMRCEWWEAVG